MVIPVTTSWTYLSAKTTGQVCDRFAAHNPCIMRELAANVLRDHPANKSIRAKRKLAVLAPSIRISHGLVNDGRGQEDNEFCLTLRIQVPSKGTSEKWYAPEDWNTFYAASRFLLDQTCDHNRLAIVHSDQR
ncbi:MAG: hypothetical protein ACI9R3_005525 [Verrucomicrobiales bacterium]|jgi:hypothetical protein